MCGRFALWLNSNQVCEKCSYCPQDDKSREEIPLWVEVNNYFNFKPSYNICPERACPVLTLSKHFKHLKMDKNVEGSERVIVPMKWGLIPNWAKQDASSKYKTINCRCETIDTKPAFRHALSHGYRCVVLAQGFYEWKNRFEPVFVHSNANEDNLNDNYENLLYLAGIFDEWKDAHTQQTIYSFSILTTNSKNTQLASIHNRMPVLLDSYEINNWLDSSKFSIQDAQKYMFAPNDCIKLHRVSMSVNNVGNDTRENVENLDLKRKKEYERNDENKTKDALKDIHKSISQYFNKTKKTRKS